MNKLRGVLTDDVKSKAETYLGREFSTEELRLYPYLVDRVLNWARIERSKTSEAEQDIISMLESEGRLKREFPSYMHPTKEFWLFMCDVLADTYVELSEDME